ncbi:hypoxia-inducible factor 1-alpha inhibitor-like isoform X2 [Dendronephthya gigantea]|uniref:hypoxia-inducible factor 1-alpha inhibitor-like isoform X2 n=1 Tax=Dendronephthya gigantea TaxID=151771 RepID=UPI0010696E34|nr:hypoxia-inducible factor 1-alpha inhibitor-like isoform X2 [Dendronephthya gigantea]
MSLRRQWSFTMLSLDVMIFALLVWATQRIVAFDACKKSDETCSANHNDYSDFVGRYTFPTTPIRAVECRSEEAIAEMTKGVPIVLKNCHFGEITQGWTFEYLKQNLLSPNLTVYKSPTRRFLFYNRENSREIIENITWSPPHNVTEMSFLQFLNQIDELEKAGNGTKAYLQSSLEKESLNSDMQDDVLMFNTKWLKDMKEKLSWGRLDVNLFLIGMGGVVTPAHYDIMENLFLQIHGKKRCILFSPENYKFLYPYPVYHPHDRQTQVNFDFPDFKKFPKFRNITGVDAVVGPGDVLYIPNYWWHYIESESDRTISMNFWYLPKDAEDELVEDAKIAAEEEQVESIGSEKEPNGKSGEQGKEDKSEIEDKEEKMEEEGEKQFNKTRPDAYTAGELIGLSRDIEAMVGEALNDVKKVGAFLKELVDGRFDHV